MIISAEYSLEEKKNNGMLELLVWCECICVGVIKFTCCNYPKCSDLFVLQFCKFGVFI